ncbi:MAG: hypothetical protein KIS68_07150 [Bauldia sp.]|nr:hypothetical protein [Bauldia sp.]
MTTYTEVPSVSGAGPPTGTVTFLFTDIEGSTRAVLALGTAAWAPILERHRALIRAAIAPSGTEIITEGDSFFVVFRSAGDAVAATVAAQRLLAAEPWPIEGGVKVRMGLHAGEGVLDADGSYVGSDVHRAARIAGAAHGGQVLLSEQVRSLAEAALPEGVAMADLGEHRLKDLQPQRLYALRIEDVPFVDLPPKSLDARPNNLPRKLTSFVGRESELGDVEALLAGTRLLTLTGPGGTGKTRLALELAASAADGFPDGVWFVELEPIRDPSLVAATIARTMGLVLTAKRPARDVVVEAVGDRRVLFVLDNFEQVIAAAPLVADFLGAASNLRIIATSRIALRVSGEQEYEVPGLPAPPDIARLSGLERENLPAEIRNPAVGSIGAFEAVRLFVDRAASVRPGFALTPDNAAAIAAICARLHGMPLAIELAAVRVKLLSPAQILGRLEEQLKVLASGLRDLPPRQQTLRGAIAWSYDLLERPLRRFLAALSVFSGGWDLEAAEAVCPNSYGAADVLEGLTLLVDHSLVRRHEADGDVRFEMFPTIREFAREQAALAGEDEAMLARHARYYLHLAEMAAKDLFGDRQRSWLDRLEREHDNLRAAIAWATRRPDPETAVRLGFAAWRFWQMRGYLDEAWMRLEAMDAAGWPLADEVRGRLVEALGGIAYWRADYDGAARFYAEAVDLWRRVGDDNEVANAIYNLSFTEILPLMQGTGGAASARDRGPRLLALCEEALGLFRRHGNRVGEGNVTWGMGGLLYFLDRAVEGEKHILESLAIFREVKDRRMEAWALHMLVLIHLRLNRAEAAEADGRAALTLFHAAGDLSGVAMVLGDLALTATKLGDRRRAGRLNGVAERLYSATGAALSAQVDRMTGLRIDAVLSPEEIAAFGAEGARLSVDEAVRYAVS